MSDTGFLDKYSLEHFSTNNLLPPFFKLARSIELTKYIESLRIWRDVTNYGQYYKEGIVTDFLVPRTVDYLLDDFQGRWVYDEKMKGMENYIKDGLKREAVKLELINFGLFGSEKENISSQVESDFVNFTLMNIQNLRQLTTEDKEEVIITPYIINSYFRTHGIKNQVLENRAKDFFRSFRSDKYRD